MVELAVQNRARQLGGVDVADEGERPVDVVERSAALTQRVRVMPAHDDVEAGVRGACLR